MNIPFSIIAALCNVTNRRLFYTCRHAAINYESFLWKLSRIKGAAWSNCREPNLMREIYIIILIMQMKLIPTPATAFNRQPLQRQTHHSEHNFFNRWNVKTPISPSVIWNVIKVQITCCCSIFHHHSSRSRFRSATARETLEKLIFASWWHLGHSHPRTAHTNAYDRYPSSRSCSLFHIKRRWSVERTTSKRNEIVLPRFCVYISIIQIEMRTITAEWVKLRQLRKHVSNIF